MKKRNIIIAVIIILLAAIGITIFALVSPKKETDLTPIAKKLFEQNINELLHEPGKENIQSSYTITKIKLLAGDSKEFVADIYYNLSATEGNDTEVVKCKWTLRIKKSSNGKYVVKEEGVHVTTKGLKPIKDTEKVSDKVSKIVNKNTLSLDTKNKYSIRGSRVSVTYDNGDKYVDVPVALEDLLSKDAINNLANNKTASLEDGSYYITPEITAFVHGGEEGVSGEPVKVTLTDNEGKSWSTYNVSGTESEYGYARKFVGFTSKDQGFVVLTSSVAMGHQENNIYITKDGGKTWSEIGNTNKTYARVVTGAGFANDKIGFVGFRYENDNNPTVYRTADAGNTWNKLYIKLPSQYKDDFATPLCPIFKGAEGLLPVYLRDAQKTIQYISYDYGQTWKFDKDLDYSNQLK